MPGKYGAGRSTGKEIKIALSAALVVVVDALCGTSSGRLTASDPLH